MGCNFDASYSLALPCLLALRSLLLHQACPTLCRQLVLHWRQQQGLLQVWQVGQLAEGGLVGGTLPRALPLGLLRLCQQGLPQRPGLMELHELLGRRGAGRGVQEGAEGGLGHGEGTPQGHAVLGHAVLGHAVLGHAVLCHAVQWLEW